MSDHLPPVVRAAAPAEEPEWRAIAPDPEGQVAYLLRRCLIAEGNAADDTDALAVLIADAEDVGRL